MTNPLRRLKFLPWRSLFLLSSLITLIVIVLDLLLTLGYKQSLAIRRALYLLYAPPLGILVNLAVIVGIGALAVYLLEKLYPKVIVNAATLWALVLCLAVCLAVKSLFVVPNVLVNFDETQLIGMMVGVFWKGRPYWR